MRKNKLKIGLIAANVAIILGLAGTSAYLFFENRDLNEVLGLSTEEKNTRLIEEVNQVYDLPDEEPVVAIVTDPEQFKTEYPTFENAQSGDYLLFFRKARLNVLYRQSEKRVVQTANVVVPIAIELVGEEADIDVAAAKLSEFGNQITLTRTVVSGISQSFVFDVDADQQAEAQSIAQLLGFDIGSTLPSAITPSEQTEVIVAVSNQPVPGTEEAVQQSSDEEPLP